MSRRKVTWTNESHPNTPPSAELDGSPLVWQVYIDGQPFVGVSVRDHDNAHEIAREHARQIEATGRYEYVDLRLRPERRTQEQRRSGTRRANDTKEQ